MIPSLTEQDLSPYFNKAEMIQQAAEQLKKDLEQFGMDIVFSGDPLNAYEELFAQTEPFVQKLIHNNYEKLFQLLYRIDVSEKLIGKAVEDSDHVSSEITRLILFRELQKVVIRNYYSK